MAFPLDLILGGVRLDRLATPHHKEERACLKWREQRKHCQEVEREEKQNLKKSFESLEEAMPDFNDLN